MTMQENSSRNGTYLEALNRLRKLIDQEYADGGKLPGARILCKKLDVCLETYMKALRELCTEGVACTTRGRGGTFIKPANERFLKAGLILQNGQESPYIGRDRFLLPVFETLFAGRIHIHQLQTPRIEKIQEIAAHHGVSALVWLAPPPSALPVIERIQADSRYPLVVTNVFHQRFRWSLLEKKLNLVTNDYSYAGRLVADFFIGRKHRSVLYIDTAESMISHRFPEFFKDSGVAFTPEHNFETKDVELLLADKIRDLNVTGIFSEGGSQVYKQISRILMTLSPSLRPEVIVRDSNDSLDFLRQAYPEIRFSALVRTDYSKLGRLAAEQIVDCLKTGTPVHPEIIPATTIEMLS